MKFGLNDRMTFGAHKGKTVKEILDKAPHWACWLRDEKRKTGEASPFTKEVHDELDRLIRKSKSLQQKFQVWNLDTTPLDQVVAGRTAQDEEAAKQERAENNERELAYAGEWGAW